MVLVYLRKRFERIEKEKKACCNPIQTSSIAISDIRVWKRKRETEGNRWWKSQVNLFNIGFLRCVAWVFRFYSISFQSNRNSGSMFTITVQCSVQFCSVQSWLQSSRRCSKFSYQNLSNRFNSLWINKPIIFLHLFIFLSFLLLIIETSSIDRINFALFFHLGCVFQWTVDTNYILINDWWTSDWFNGKYRCVCVYDLLFSFSYKFF